MRGFLLLEDCRARSRRGCASGCGRGRQTADSTPNLAIKQRDASLRMTFLWGVQGCHGKVQGTHVCIDCYTLHPLYSRRVLYRRVVISPSTPVPSCSGISPSTAVMLLSRPPLGLQGYGICKFETDERFGGYIDVAIAGQSSSGGSRASAG